MCLRAFQWVWKSWHLQAWKKMTNQLQSMFQSLGSDKTKKRKMKIKDALKP